MREVDDLPSLKPSLAECVSICSKIYAEAGELGIEPAEQSLLGIGSSLGQLLLIAIVEPPQQGVGKGNAIHREFGSHVVCQPHRLHPTPVVLGYLDVFGAIPQEHARQFSFLDVKWILSFWRNLWAARLSLCGCIGRRFCRRSIGILGPSNQWLLAPLLAHLGGKQLFAQAELAGSLLNVERTGNAVGDKGYALHHILRQLGQLGRIALASLESIGGFEMDEIFPVTLYKILDFG